MKSYFIKLSRFSNKLFASLFGETGISKMTSDLDMDLFHKKVKIPFVIVKSSNVPLAINLFKRDLLKSKLGRIREADDNCKKMRLDPLVINDEEDIEKYKSNQTYTEIVEKFGFEELNLSYDDLSLKETLCILLPKDNFQSKNINSTGHKIIGHIVQINLRDELLPYKYQIGQILLDKIKVARTVVNKVGRIDNAYRNLDFELIAGEPDYVTKCKENHITYSLDFSKVYWNPNLATERERIIENIKAGEYVYDVFAGIGPFAIPLALRGCFVFANDLNPDCAHWLKYNFDANKKQRILEPFNIYNMDGREFLRDVAIPRFINNRHHIIMNLPETSVSFLSEFNNIEWQGDNTTVHIYCYAFVVDDEVANTIKHELIDNLPQDISASFTGHFVRNVSPKKMVMCYDIRLTKTFEPPAKRLKITETD